jgi:hypothetical protein
MRLVSSSLKNELPSDTGICRIENQTRMCLIYGASRGRASRRKALKNTVAGVFQQTI